MVRVSLNDKLVLYFVLLGILTIVIISSVTLNFQENSLINRTFDQLTSLREAKKKAIENYFSDCEKEVNILKKLNWELYSNEFTPNSFKHIVRIDHPLDSILKNSHYESIFLHFPESKLNMHFGKQSQIEDNNLSVADTLVNMYNRSNKTVLVYDLKSIDGTSEGIYFCSQIQISEKPALLIFKLRNKEIDALMFENSLTNGLGKTGETYLVGKDFLMRSSSRFFENSVLTIKVKTEAVKLALSNKTGTKIIKDYRGINTLSSYTSLNINGLEWVLLAEIDFEEAMIPVYQIRNTIVIIGILIATILFIFSFVISRRLTKPLVELTEAVQQIGDGKLPEVPTIRTNDEIGELTSSFNNMVERLSIQAKEIADREDRLKHFYEATMDGILLQENCRAFMVNKAMVLLSGYSENELLSMDLNQIFVPFNCENDLIHNNKTITYESELKCKNNTSLSVEIGQSRIQFGNKSIIAVVIRDISERIAAQNIVKEQRISRLRSMIDGQDIERLRLSRELHDGVGQSMIAIRFLVESVNVEESTNVKEKMKFLKNSIDNLIEDIRRISNNLMPAGLEEFGLTTAIQNLCNQIPEALKMEVKFESQGDFKNLSKQTKTYFFRIIQEAINNAIKHSEASILKIQILHTEVGISLEICDNGKGFELIQNMESPTSGLINMRERAGLLGGEFSIETEFGKGTRIIILVAGNKLSF